MDAGHRELGDRRTTSLARMKGCVGMRWHTRRVLIQSVKKALGRLVASPSTWVGLNRSQKGKAVSASPPSREPITGRPYDPRRENLLVPSFVLSPCVQQAYLAYQFRVEWDVRRQLSE
jgi:hypothetical protein